MIPCEPDSSPRRRPGQEVQEASILTTCTRAGVAAGALTIAAVGGATAAAAGAAPVRPPATGGAAAGSRALSIPVGKRFDVAKRKRHVRAGRRVVVRGHGVPGTLVRYQARRDGHWRTLGRVHVRGGGRFTATARPRAAMSVRTRVRSGGRTRRAGRLNVYRPAFVSWYGPGLYGNRLGCGGTLTPGTLGVANKSLPCGTRLTLRHGRHTVRVRVVDRGPYVGGREYDLTSATARRLHFNGVGSILTTR